MPDIIYQPSLFDQPQPNSPKKPAGTPELREQARRLRAAGILCAVLGVSETEAMEVIEAAGGVHPLARLPERALLSLPHIGKRRAAQLKNLTEWALLLAEIQTEAEPQIRTPADAANLMMLEMSLLDQEEVRVLGLDTHSFVTCRKTVYRGSLNTALVRIGEILRTPVLHNCAAIIVLHNHPSGDPTPSPVIWRKSQIQRSLLLSASRCLAIQ
ncbi:MAG: JAB domain-containing protein [Caldilineaceae bacterium]